MKDWLDIGWLSVFFVCLVRSVMIPGFLMPDDWIERLEQVSKLPCDYQTSGFSEIEDKKVLNRTK